MAIRLAAGSAHALEPQFVVQCRCGFLGRITAFELVVVTGNRVRRLLARASDEIQRTPKLRSSSALLNTARGAAGFSEPPC